MKLGIAGRKALVLGGGRGLGLAVARALAAEGVDLVISSRSLERLEEAARAIRADHAVKVTAAACDMSDRDQVSALWKETERQLGQVDILLNNHGGPPLGLAADLEENALLAHFTPMVESVIRLTRLALPGMRERRWGRILTIGSSGMIQQLPNMALSNTLRAAIVGYMKTLASEVAADGVTVNILAPGKVYTDRVQSSAETNAGRLGVTVEEIKKRSIADIPVGRYGLPEEVGAMAAFLCGEQAGFMTGSIWRVEGGLIRSIL